MAERKSLLNFISANATIDRIALRLIDFNSNQPRKYFNPAKMRSLEKSIKSLGVRQPILVQPRGGRYFLVCGERRVRAAMAIGLMEIPAVLLEPGIDDYRLKQIALVENLQREELNPLEETEGVMAFLSMRLNLTQPELVSKFHRILNEERGLIVKAGVKDSPEGQELLRLFEETTDIGFEHFVKNRMKLLRLETDIADRIRSGEISYSSSMEIAKLPKDKREEIFNQAIAEDWGFDKVRQVVRELKGNSSTPQGRLKERFNELSTRLKRSNLWQNPEKHSRLEKVLEELEGLLKDED